MIFLNTGKLQPISSDIWKILSTNLDDKIKPNTLYISVYQNRHLWQTKLRANSGFHSKEDNNTNNSQLEVESDSSERSHESLTSGQTIF